MKTIWIMLGPVVTSTLFQLAFADASEVKKQLEEAENKFTYQSKNINPRGIHILMPWMSDALPGAASIYLEGTAPSTNQFNAELNKVEDGVVSIGTQYGWFAYKHLGRLKNGSHVLEVWENTGGSGTFTSLLLVKFSIEPEVQPDGSKADQLVLKRTGSISLGDRFNGSVKVTGSVIEITNDGQFGRDSSVRKIHINEQ